MKNELASKAELAKAVADPTRLGILILLAREGEVCVCDMAGKLDEPDFKISRHLAILKKSGLVDFRREKVWMHYSLAPAGDPVHQAMLDFIARAAESIPLEQLSAKSTCCKPSPKKAGEA